MAQSPKKPQIILDKAKFKGMTYDQIANNMLAAVIYLRDRIKIKLNRGQRTRTTAGGNIIGLSPSKPGEPPKKITGQLQNSIQGAVDRQPNEISGRVGSGLEKAKYLEMGTDKMKPRPFLRPTMLEEQDKLVTIVAKGLAGAGSTAAPSASSSSGRGGSSGGAGKGGGGAGRSRDSRGRFIKRQSGGGRARDKRGRYIKR